MDFSEAKDISGIIFQILGALLSNYRPRVNYRKAQDVSIKSPGI
jgi:hypothetical protein